MGSGETPITGSSARTDRPSGGAAAWLAASGLTEPAVAAVDAHGETGGTGIAGEVSGGD